MRKLLCILSASGADGLVLSVIVAFLLSTTYREDAGAKPPLGLERASAPLAPPRPPGSISLATLDEKSMRDVHKPPVVSGPDEAFARDLRLVFEASPDVLLVFFPDALRYTMVAATNARLAATHTTREQTIGRSLFEVFPDNPDDPDADWNEQPPRVARKIETVVTNATQMNIVGVAVISKTDATSYGGKASQLRRLRDTFHSLFGRPEKEGH